MQFKVQVVTLRDDGEESLREVACVERDDLSAVSLGLSIADSKAILQGIQEVVVAWQMHEYLDFQRHCPDCGKLRHGKGSHHPGVALSGDQMGVFIIIWRQCETVAGCIALR